VTPEELVKIALQESLDRAIAAEKGGTVQKAVEP
jgi:hypothetical protein